MSAYIILNSSTMIDDEVVSDVSHGTYLIDFWYFVFLLFENATISFKILQFEWHFRMNTVLIKRSVFETLRKVESRIGGNQRTGILRILCCFC